MSDYANFEKVGYIDTNLPRNSNICLSGVSATYLHLVYGEFLKSAHRVSLESKL